ncbi:monooxygenase 1-like isoform X2 [Diospyros lotus]|uniref:monooxygenase 1-like isoform X1 n=1 Tax=Diospyros lotus TaxID=55363 RepID=UPI002254BB13|nr:monooxygenase 1-like isoform X1 [Diospyros lotus]XP_052192288.1 monooxygenase 1-like isoform X2 [Diospyros lotus]
MDMSEEKEEEYGIVIVGGGICGLATALALHRKGIRSVVLERSESVRASGAAIGILANGWRALHSLGVASSLRLTALPLKGGREVSLDKGLTKKIPLGIGEARCLKRSDLVNALADSLPPGTIKFGCQVVSVKLPPRASHPILQLLDGRSIVAKIVIGCDGSNSVIADYLGLKHAREFSLSAVRGLTNYPNGHAFPFEAVRMRRNNTIVGRVPIHHKLVYWFVSQRSPSCAKDVKASEDPEIIRQLAAKSAVNDFPAEFKQMIEDSDLESLSLTRLRYRAPWDLLMANFRQGTVTVAGDAMHVMGPFLGQGGSAGLEDAVVLGRCLAGKLGGVDGTKYGRPEVMKKVAEGMDEYVKERRMRVVRLSTQTYLIGLLFQPDPSLLVKVVCIVLMAVLFRDPMNHARYDCGPL